MASTMRFDTWETPLGVTSLQADSSGRVSSPNMPIISGQMGSYGSITAAQKVPFDEFWVQRGITYDSTTRRFTVPKTGIYRVQMAAFTLSGYAGTRLLVGVNTDAPGLSSHRGHIYNADTSHSSMDIHSVIPLNAGDWVVFYLYGGALYNATNDRFNQFSIEMIA